ncbi:hypothetical protein RSSM_02387 [Rhodopirellula sallentina SM41]|uniref:Uncharacterized protein n=1 Tax=Rhodopirellula sallentina SM41 TaxID=1263870 RepID=M5U411_9BACT|nr:hypothetical protein RSSM_02387 [Rhodopirellula sallentina SM41]
MRIFNKIHYRLPEDQAASEYESIFVEFRDRDRARQITGCIKTFHRW